MLFSRNKIQLMDSLRITEDTRVAWRYYNANGKENFIKHARMFSLEKRMSILCRPILLIWLLLDLHIMHLEKLYQCLFDYLALSTQAAFGLHGVNLQGFGYRFR